MPPIIKKIKLEKPKTNLIHELATFQKEIRKIKEQTEDIGNFLLDEDDTATATIIKVDNEHDYEETYNDDDQLESTGNNNNSNDGGDDIKKYIREQIRISERRIHHRFDQLERKLNRLLERQSSHNEEEVVVEEHLMDYDAQADSGELDNRMFPIIDEPTFDWFFEKLKDPDFCNALIQRRWQLTRMCSNKSFNVSVKDFLRMHFELPVVVKYSVSGFGAHGTRKKKLDSATLNSYVYECFNMALPGFHSYQDVGRAIVQFWGRAPDTLNKTNERAIKRDCS